MHFFFLSIGREPTTWPANNCLQIMVCSCVVPSKRVLLQIIFCSCVIGTTSREKNGRSLPWAVRKWLKYENKLGDRLIKQLLNSVIAKYRDLSVSRRSIICLSLRLRQIIDLLATDKSRYFAQPHPIIVNYFSMQRVISHRVWLSSINCLFTYVPKKMSSNTLHFLSFKVHMKWKIISAYLKGLSRR